MLVTVPPPSTPGGATLPEGYATTSVLVRTPDGRLIPLCLWLAETPTEQANGLMGVTGLGGAHGMLFRFAGQVTDAFYMFKTLLPLTVVFYRDGAYVSSADMPPCTAKSGDKCPLYSAKGPYDAAIEVLRRDAERLGLVAGSTLDDRRTSCTPTT